MSHGNSKWEPTNRAAKLKMANDWKDAFGSKPYGGTITNQERWRVPPEMSEQLNGLINHITGMQLRPTSEQTANSKKDLSVKYEELTTLMREIKRMCFMTPPCTEGDYILLGLPIPDREPTSVEPPKSVPEIIHSNSGKLKVRLDIKHEFGVDENRHADYGCKIKGCIVPRGSAPGPVSPCGITYKTDGEPQHEYQLAWDTFTRKNKLELTFHQDDFEGRFYYCARFENSKGQGGPWSPVAFSVIA